MIRQRAARLSMAVILSLTATFTDPAIAAGWLRRGRPCATLLLKATDITPVEKASAAHPAVKIPPEKALHLLMEAIAPLRPQPQWTNVVNAYLLPAFHSQDQNLVLVLAGPTNVGKSTILNSLPAIHNSQIVHSDIPSLSSFNAESTARPVIMFNAGMFDERGNFDNRFSRTERWRDNEQVLYPGPSLVYPVKDFYQNLVFVDTPAFNWPASKDIATEQIRKADIIIYAFSNANYADEANLNFVNQMIEENGLRDLILIYNVNAAIPQDVVRAHLQYVSNSIFKNPDGRELPHAVIGAYHMVHSEKVARGEEEATMIPLNGSPNFANLLQSLDENALAHRRQALSMGLQYVLEAAEKTLAQREREILEFNLTQKIFETYLDHLIDTAVEHVPYDGLGLELEQIWDRHSAGFRGFALWIAHPVHMSGFSLGRASQTPSVEEIKRYLDSVVDSVTAKFQLGVAQGRIQLPLGDERTDQLIKELEGSGIQVSATEKGYEIQLPQSEPLKMSFEQYLGRNWSEVTSEIKEEVRENFSRLTLEIQSQLNEVAQSQPITIRTQRAMFTTLALLPPAIAAAIMAYRSRDFIDFQTVGTAVTAWLGTRLFINLNDYRLGGVWIQSVRDWFMERQRPRLHEILGRHLLLMADTVQRADPQKIRTAIESLEATGMQQ